MDFAFPKKKEGATGGAFCLSRCIHHELPASELLRDLADAVGASAVSTTFSDTQGLRTLGTVLGYIESLGTVGTTFSDTQGLRTLGTVLGNIEGLGTVRTTFSHTQSLGTLGAVLCNAVDAGAVSATFSDTVDGSAVGTTLGNRQCKSGSGQAGDEQAGEDLLFHFGHLGWKGLEFVYGAHVTDVISMKK